MAEAHVLRFARSDEEGGFVLVHAKQTRSKALDMKLIGTDGLAPYVISLRHSQAASHMSKNCPVSEEEWIDILKSLLRQEVVEGVEGIASVESESAIVLNFRKRVRGITQRLGTIELKHNPEEEIELYDWCGASVEAAAGAKESLASVTAKTKELEASLVQLRAQLDELIEAKKTDETEMLHKFRDLLNEKKIKIREQQKIIATASVDAAGVESEKPSPEPPRGKERVAGKSRPSKRKAPAQDAEEDGESSDGFEKMDVSPAAQEQKGTAAQLSDEERQTSGGETETASEEDEQGDDDEDMEGEEQPRKAKPATRAAAQSSASQSQSRSQSTSQSTASKKGEEPPAKRELPFGRKRAEPPKKEAPPAQAEGSETESDDEL